MNVIDVRKLRDAKMRRMLQGESVYVETSEMLRLLKRAIKRQALNVRIDYGHGGYWFMLQEEE